MGKRGPRSGRNTFHRLAPTCNGSDGRCGEQTMRPGLQRLDSLCQAEFYDALHAGYFTAHVSTARRGGVGPARCRAADAAKLARDCQVGCPFTPHPLCSNPRGRWHARELTAVPQPFKA